MKKLSILFLCILSIFVEVKTPRAEGHDAQNTILALNYAIMSIYRVEKFPSRLTVDEEYNGIINNLAIGNITDDSELKQLFTSMMTAYTEEKLDDKEKEFIQRQYEAKVNATFLKLNPNDQLKDVAVSTASEISSTLLGNFATGPMGCMILSGGVALKGIGEYIFAVQNNEKLHMQANNKIQEFSHEQKVKEWTLDKEKIRRFNDLKTKLLDAEWTLLRKYNIPDEARLTEETIQQYYSFIADNDIARALRSAKRIEEKFKFYPPFWFYYGKVALENKDIELARACFDKFFEQSKPILRRDQFAAATARYKIFALNNTENEEFKNLLGVIERNSSDEDWNNFLFCSLQWYLLGDKNKADELLLRNIDCKHDVALHKELRTQVKNGKLDIKKIKSIIVTEFTDCAELETLASSGSIEAQYRLGEMLYRNGRTNEAISWLTKAAQENYFLAKARLDLIELKNNKNSSKIIQRNLYPELSKVAMDNDDAKIMLVDYCLLELEGAKNNKTAFDIFSKIANKKDYYVEQQIGYCYENGIGIKKDEQKAFQLYQEFAKEGNILAQERLAHCYENGIGIKRNDEKAFEWYQKSAEKGYAPAQNSLANYYRKGIFIKEDEVKAFQFYQKAAEQGYAPAQNYLGVCYRNGIGVPKDEEKAFFWHQKASAQGYASAQNNLGYCYEKGIGIQKDESKAFSLYTVSAEQGNPIAQNNLGYCYENGIGTQKDENKALHWYKQFSTHDESTIKSHLDYCYAQKDIDKAMLWIKNMAEHGFENTRGLFRRLIK